jgi:CRISPR/Cas system-associated exonuclease Cas4 (RecB family)
MSVEDIVLHGQIDLWFEEGGEIVLVDYKTDQVDAADAPAHATRYAVQVCLYAFALERMLGRRPDRAYLFLLRPGLAVPVNVRDEDIAEALAAVRRFQEAQAALRFEMRVTPSCPTCPYYRRPCPADSCP